MTTEQTVGVIIAAIFSTVFLFGLAFLNRKKKNS